MTENDHVLRGISAKSQNVQASRTVRQARIVEILENSRVHSQVQLSELLLDEGIDITQATLSRDLDELGARKIRPDSGRAFYSLMAAEAPLTEAMSGPAEKLRRMLDDILVSAEYSWNMAVLKTPPGAAQYLASFIDRASLDDIAGVIAGDDTIFVLAKEPNKGKDLQAIFDRR